MSDSGVTTRIAALEHRLASLESRLCRQDELEAEIALLKDRLTDYEESDRSAMNRAISVFWKRVRKAEGCWEWQGAKSPSGYGNLTAAGRTWRAHRFAWIISNGPIPPGLYVLHSCDNPCCVRPDHLTIGDGKENMAQAKARSRLASGERHWTVVNPENVGRGDSHYTRTRPQLIIRGSDHYAAQFTEAQVVEFRRRYARGDISQAELARQAGLKTRTMGKILTGQTWRHVPFPEDPAP